MKYEVIDNHGSLIDTFDLLKDAELFIAEQPAPTNYDIREINECECKKPMNLFLSQGGLTK